MVGDVVYKIFRKLLPPFLYRSISRSFLGRQKKWKRIETYLSTFEFYRSQGYDFTGRGVAEIGCGDQFYTAIFFLEGGAKEVLLVEPTLVMDIDKLAAELARYNQHASKNLRLEEVKDKILCFRDLSEVPAAFDAQVDLAFSYLVLEHFRDIESFFFHTKRILKPAGISCNLVDLSDHTYHIFMKYPSIRKVAVNRLLHHLRYSDRLFRVVNDPKCFMNRKLLPEYLSLAQKHDLRVAKLTKETDKNAVIHRDLVRKYPLADSDDLKTVNFLLELEKRA
jgi:SAM-dependent methyltransferase